MTYQIQAIFSILLRYLIAWHFTFSECDFHDFKLLRFHQSHVKLIFFRHIQAYAPSRGQHRK